MWISIHTPDKDVWVETHTTGIRTRGSERARGNVGQLTVPSAHALHSASREGTTVPRVLVTLCTYNERDNLEPLIERILESAPEVEILVVDDNSPDGTGVLADQLAERCPQVHVLHRPAKRGLGRATHAALEWALERDYDFWLNMDADFSHDPRMIPALIECMREADIGIGSRYVPGGGVTGWGLGRRLMSRSINRLARLALGLKTRDNSGSFRCYRLSTLGDLDLSRFRATGYAVQEELLYRCRRAGCRFKEVPIIFRDRQVGQSKINLQEAVLAGWVMLQLAWDRLRGAPVTRSSVQVKSIKPEP